MPTIDELIYNPKRHTLVILAIQEVVIGAFDGPARAEYLASRKEALEALRNSKTWVITEGHPQGVRLDGVRIYPGLPDSPLSGGVWVLELPPVEFGARPRVIQLEAGDLVSAVEQVDERYPMPAWWVAVDQAARPFRYPDTP